MKKCDRERAHTLIDSGVASMEQMEQLHPRAA